MKMKILLVEDDAAIGQGLVDGLAQSDIEVVWLQSGREAEREDVAQYAAVILDLGLPKVDGMALLTHWRESGKTTPVLILTARDGLEDKLNGLRGGADDYMVKPFALDEVEARLQILNRRNQPAEASVIHFGHLQVSLDSCSAQLNHETLPLARREWLLLEMLITAPSRVFSRAQIETRIYGWEQEINSNAVEVHVHNLRAKLGKNFILTRRGLGYQLGEKP